MCGQQRRPSCGGAGEAPATRSRSQGAVMFHGVQSRPRHPDAPDGIGGSGLVLYRCHPTPDQHRDPPAGANSAAARTPADSAEQTR